jgi:hypothetical protein
MKFGLKTSNSADNVYDKQVVQTSESYTVLAQYVLLTSFTNPATNSPWMSQWETMKDLVSPVLNTARTAYTVNLLHTCSTFRPGDPV